ncbi:hypothetical protein swp_3827 [Shewanella piezotolerans WP3]|uniref:Uncharacterized protein n=1 Tax=Shewanella piezotolerans (strain WP3 / JCM 13877) TaxID=225849 RepID=B8CQP0_SHEPW|nr:hypothetical protein swp_3827 [Shewanella piezotolerans WP3]
MTSSEYILISDAIVDGARNKTLLKMAAIVEDNIAILDLE